MKNQDDYIRVTFRCPPELHKKLSTSSMDSDCSLNSEIIKRIQKGYMDEENDLKQKTRKSVSHASNEIRKLAHKISQLCLDED